MKHFTFIMMLATMMAFICIDVDAQSYRRNRNGGLLIDKSSAGTYNPTPQRNSSGQSNSSGFLINQSSPGTYDGPIGGNVISNDEPYETPSTSSSTTSSSHSTTTVAQKDCRQCYGLKYCRTCGGDGVMTGFTLKDKLKCSTCSGTGVCNYCHGTGKR